MTQRAGALLSKRTSPQDHFVVLSLCRAGEAGASAGGARVFGGRVASGSSAAERPVRAPALAFDRECAWEVRRGVVAPTALVRPVGPAGSGRSAGLSARPAAGSVGIGGGVGASV